MKAAHVSPAFATVEARSVGAARHGGALRSYVASAGRAYRRAARAAPPDTGGSAAAFARVTSAWSAASQHFAGGAP